MIIDRTLGEHKFVMDWIFELQPKGLWDGLVPALLATLSSSLIWELESSPLLLEGSSAHSEFGIICSTRSLSVLWSCSWVMEKWSGRLIDRLLEHLQQCCKDLFKSMLLPLLYQWSWAEMSFLQRVSRLSLRGRMRNLLFLHTERCSCPTSSLGILPLHKS